MQEKQLNIISFDNPYPPNYGGVIDVYYKIEALYRIGYKIHLHCFVKEVPDQHEELSKITASISFYLAEPKWYHFLSSLPLSIISRSNKDLVDNLIVNDAPIIFESLKSTCLMNDYRLKKRFKILRLHNIEQNYFQGISKSDTNLLKKLLYSIEASKYKKYDFNILNFQKVFTLSKYENSYIEEKYNNGFYVPVFHGNKEVIELSEYGKYSIFHGDLSTSDNRKVALFLIDVFKDLPDYKLVIASGVGGDFVMNAIGNYKNIEYIDLLDFSHLKSLLNQAHISISWSFQKSGTKLKLLNSLFNSRHNIVNDNIIDDEMVYPICHVATNKKELIDKIIFLYKIPYSNDEYQRKREVLENTFNDDKNAILIDSLIKNISNE